MTRTYPSPFFHSASFCIITISSSPLVVLVGSEQRVTGISCGAFHTGVVTAKGGLYMFGRGDSGQLGLDTTDHSFIPRLVSSISQKVTKLSCGVDHTICCTCMGFYHPWANSYIYYAAQGALYGFGSNSKGQLGIGQSAQEIFVSPQRITYQSQDTNVSSTTFPSSLATGHSFTAMIADGCVYTWGQNDKVRHSSRILKLFLIPNNRANVALELCLRPYGLQHRLNLRKAPLQLA